MSTPKLKLTYFNLMGLGEPIRYILAYADVEYEDFRIKHVDWPTYKENFAYKQLPVLEVDGKALNQSVAIARYLGKKFNLVSADPFIDAQLEAVVDSLRDMMSVLRKHHTAKTPETKKESEESIAFTLSRLESLASEGYLYGKKVTWVDIYFSGFMDTMSHYAGDILAPYPNLKAMAEKIRATPTLKKYIEKRPPQEQH